MSRTWGAREKPPRKAKEKYQSQGKANYHSHKPKRRTKVGKKATRGASRGKAPKRRKLHTNTTGEASFEKPGSGEQTKEGKRRPPGWDILERNSFTGVDLGPRNESNS